MRELVPLTNAVAARMITSALSRRGGDHAILSPSHAHARSRVLTAAKAAIEDPSQDTPGSPRGQERSGGSGEIVCA